MKLWMCVINLTYNKVVISKYTGFPISYLIFRMKLLIIILVVSLIIGLPIFFFIQVPRCEDIRRNNIGFSGSLEDPPKQELSYACQKVLGLNDLLK